MPFLIALGILAAILSPFILAGIIAFATYLVLGYIFNHEEK